MQRSESISYALKSILVASSVFCLLFFAGCDMGTYDKRFRERNTTEPVDVEKADKKQDAEAEAEN
jgi:hypothetical protein